MWIYDTAGNLDLNGDGVPDAFSHASRGQLSLFDCATWKFDVCATIPGKLTGWKLHSGADAEKILFLASRSAVVRSKIAVLILAMTAMVLSLPAGMSFISI